MAKVRAMDRREREKASRGAKAHLDENDLEDSSALHQHLYQQLMAMAKMPTTKEPEQPDMEKILTQEEFEAKYREEVIENRALMEEKRSKASEYKKRGNQAFRDQNYLQAIKWYTKSTGLVSWNPVTFTNRALAFIKLGLYNRAVRDCDTALDINPKCLKALVYKAKSLYLLGDVASSEILIEEASKHHPQQKTYIMEFRDEWLLRTEKGLAGTVDYSDTAACRESADPGESQSEPSRNSIGVDKAEEVIQPEDAETSARKDGISIDLLESVENMSTTSKDTPPSPQDDGTD